LIESHDIGKCFPLQGVGGKKRGELFACGCGMRYQDCVVDIGDKCILGNVWYEYIALPKNRVVPATIQQVNLYTLPARRGGFDGTPFELEKTFVVCGSEDTLVVPLHSHTRKRNRPDEVQLCDRENVAQYTEGVSLLLLFPSVAHMAVHNEVLLMAVAIKHLDDSIVKIDPSSYLAHAMQIYYFKSGGIQNERHW
jgi:hypothetical protein